MTAGFKVKSCCEIISYLCNRRLGVHRSGHIVIGNDMAPKPDLLPVSLPPRGLSRVQSAFYVGNSPTLFDENDPGFFPQEAADGASA